MRCANCSGALDADGICPVCSPVNPKADGESSFVAQPARNASMRIFMGVIIALDAMTALMYLFAALTVGRWAVFSVFAVIIVALCVFEITTAVFVLRYKLWALIVFLALSALNGTVLLIVSNLFVTAIHTLMLIMVFGRKWKNFK